jgi:hypothetical protein
MFSQPDHSQPDYSTSTLSAETRQRLLTQLRSDKALEKLTSPDLDQMFVLIDGILPFEACLYYQVLPLFLDGNRLNLGMVSPDDSIAFEYVRRMISYLNYQLVPQSITSEAHQLVLTTHLNHSADKKPRRTPNPYRSYRTVIRSRREQSRPQSDRATLQLQKAADSTPPAPAAPAPAAPKPHAVSPAANPFSFADELPMTVAEPLTDAANSEKACPSSASSSPDLITRLPILDISTNHRHAAIDALARLAPADLLQALFARILDGGIGRLYFESTVHHGRILWSQDGVLQSVLQTLPLATLHAVIDELKQMAYVHPAEPAANLSPNFQPDPASPLVAQVEVEYLYQNNRVLLRFQFMQTAAGPAATVQILRGTALKFYQQQQIKKLERDAMGIAKQLQIKLNEIRDRAHAEPGLAGARFEVLPSLNQLLKSMEQDLQTWIDPAAL